MSVPSDDIVYHPKDLARLLHVTPQTLIHWAEAGKLTAFRTEGGHRRYKCDPMLLPRVHQPTNHEKRSVVYARVSSAKQVSDLQRQVAMLQARYPGHHVVQDIGSGINFNRRGLRSILDAAIGGHLSEVVVAHRDRLARFGFDMFQYLFTRLGVSLTVLSDSDFQEPGEQLAADVLSVITVFAARYHGRRSYLGRRGNKLRDRLQKNQVLSDAKASRAAESLPRRVKVLLQPRHQRPQGQRRSEEEKSRAAVSA